MNNKTIKNFIKNGTLEIEEVIKEYNLYIYKIIKNSIDNDEDIEELLSDVFIALWKNREILNNDMEMKPYLIGITRNLIKKKYRDTKIDLKIESIDIYENEIINLIDISATAEKNDKARIVSETIDKMKKDERKIFIMFYYKSKKVKEIAKEMNLSESKVKITLYRLRKKIKKELKERGYNYV